MASHLIHAHGRRLRRPYGRRATCRAFFCVLRLCGPLACHRRDPRHGGIHVVPAVDATRRRRAVMRQPRAVAVPCGDGVGLASTPLPRRRMPRRRRGGKDCARCAPPYAITRRVPRRSMAAYSPVPLRIEGPAQRQFAGQQGPRHPYDFGFLLGTAPGGSFSLERVPFKLTASTPRPWAAGRATGLRTLWCCSLRHPAYKAPQNLGPGRGHGADSPFPCFKTGTAAVEKMRSLGGISRRTSSRGARRGSREASQRGTRSTPASGIRREPFCNFQRNRHFSLGLAERRAERRRAACASRRARSSPTARGARRRDALRVRPASSSIAAAPGIAECGAVGSAEHLRERPPHLEHEFILLWKRCATGIVLRSNALASA